MNFNAAVNQDYRYAKHAYWSSEWSFIEDEAQPVQKATEKQRLESIDVSSSLRRPDTSCVLG